MLRIFEWNRSGIRFRMSGEFRVENVKLPFCPWVAIYQNTPECFCPFLCCFSSAWHVAPGPERGSTGLTRFSFPLTGYPVRRYSFCVLIPENAKSPASFSVSRSSSLLSAEISPPFRFRFVLRRYSSLILSNASRFIASLFCLARLRSGFLRFLSRFWELRRPRFPSLILRRIDLSLRREIASTHWFFPGLSDCVILGKNPKP